MSMQNPGHDQNDTSVPADGNRQSQPDTGADADRHPAGAASAPKRVPDELRVNISTADDINVDEDNDAESPKKSLTAADPEEHKPAD